jgi:hypothetical protein
VSSNNIEIRDILLMLLGQRHRHKTLRPDRQEEYQNPGQVQIKDFG